MDKEVEIKFDKLNNQSLAIINDDIIGRCSFTIKDNKWYINHTVVKSEYGGRGIAKQLVSIIVNEARKQGVKIVPICSYAQKMLLGKEEYQDIL